MKSDGHRCIYLHLLVAAEEEARALSASPLADAPQPHAASSQLALSRRPADSKEPGYQVLEEALSKIDSHLRVDRGQRTVYCPLCPSFSITLPVPPLINECRDVRNRCTEHVRGKDHLAQLAQPFKQQTLAFKPAPSGSVAHDSR
jgi:hypothetical protein